jgi:CDP-paratose 2-epimerase
VAKHIVIGGAGFIGINCAQRLQADDQQVVVVDDLSRHGTQANLDWLGEQGEFTFIKADIRVSEAMDALFAEHGDCESVIHLAGQTAVTKSVQQPREDFEINALGTFNILDALRRAEIKPLLIYASSNKVYGELEGLAVEERDTRYAFRGLPYGVPETQALDFHTPYGCSKGAGEQYILGFARIYDIPAVVFRQSCIYGLRQLGVEDQGWLAWFVIAAQLGRPITVYGNGKQLRDILFVDDLIEAYLRAIERKDVAAGKVYNIGGGPANTVSIWREFGPILEELKGAPVATEQAEWRPGDQPAYISDVRRVQTELGWRPKVAVHDGVGRLYDWVADNSDLFKALHT